MDGKNKRLRSHQHLLLLNDAIILRKYKVYALIKRTFYFKHTNHFARLLGKKNKVNKFLSNLTILKKYFLKLI
jgi:hypothetical protein